MRVAVHFPPDHPTSPGAISAYNLGRIEDGTHNKVWHTGETTDIREFVDGIIARAKNEFPDCEIVLERLIHDSEHAGESKWIPADELDETEHVPVGAGLPAPDAEVTAEQPVDSETEGS